jgi:hypothetical protein
MSNTTSFHSQLLTKIERDVLDSLLSDSPDRKTFSGDEILRTVFVNYRLDNGVPKGLRLTNFGNKILAKHYQHYKYSIEDEINNLVFVSLDKSMKWPYYLGTRNNHVVFYSEEDAAWFRLNGNKITSYVESI